MVKRFRIGWKGFRSNIDRRLDLVFLTSLVLLAAGLVVPAITIHRFVFVREYSLLESILAFARSGQYFLFAVTFLFSIVLPVAKIGICLVLWQRRDDCGTGTRRLLAALSVASKWSMLDVFVIALVVVVVDGSLLSSADVRAGTVLFTSAVLLSMFATHRLSAVIAGGSRFAERGGTAALIPYRHLPMLGGPEAGGVRSKAGRGMRRLSQICEGSVAPFPAPRDAAFPHETAYALARVRPFNRQTKRGE